MGDLESLGGRGYGPSALAVTEERVAAFVAATGDDPDRWTTTAPPLFANVALFAAAPSFLEDPSVVPFTRSLIHSEQVYEWHRALGVGETVEVTGTVTAVRARASLRLVTFQIAATGDRGPWLSGTSGFVLSAEAAAAANDGGEPPVSARPTLTIVPGTTLPDPGSPIPAYGCGASRADLVRYAAASGDWNPIHWDHESARAAGLPGTVVHGLLMAAWMANSVTRLVPGDAPLRDVRLRFRSPLRPGVAAEVTGSVAAAGPEGAEVDLVLESGDERLVTGRIRVTP